MTAPLTLVLQQDTGIDGDKISSSGALRLVGTVAPGARVEYRIDAGDVWSSVFTAQEGDNTVWVRQTDATGIVTGAIAPFEFTLDKQVATPTLALRSDSGTPGDRVTNRGDLAIGGLETGATTEYSLDLGKTWSGSFQALPGPNTVSVRQTDQAGNVSAWSAELRFSLALSAAAPTLSLAQDTGASPTDRVTTVGTIKVGGIEPTSTWQFSSSAGANGLPAWQAGAGSSFELAEGSYAAGVVQVRQTDGAGNTATTGFTAALSVDNTVVGPTPRLLRDTGVAGDDRSSDGSLQLQGLEPGATAEFSLDAGDTWHASFVPKEGDNLVWARQIDSAGNVSGAGPFLPFVLDSKAAAPTLALKVDSGASQTDRLTNDGTLVMGGVEPGASLQYNGRSDGFDWLSKPALSDGANVVYVRQIDLAGNASAASAPLSFTLEAGSMARSVDLLAYGWKSHSLLDAVSVGIGSQAGATDSLGATQIAGLSAVSLPVTATRAVAPADSANTAAAVDLRDAIAILKLIVGLDLNAAGHGLSPYQSFAADVDGNGKIELADAIAVLKHVVGLDAPAPQWLFFDETDSSLAARDRLNPGNVPALETDLSGFGLHHIGLVGVLRGDVDGSFAAANPGPSLADTYFQDLAATTGLNLTQFGIYGP